MTPDGPLFACIEAGGTKFVAAIANASGLILESARFDTISPDETIGAVTGWLNDAASRHSASGNRLAAAGIASFGPLELNRKAENWGYITGSPKLGWSHCDFAGRVGRDLGVPVGFDTDVNGAALAEARWGAGRDQAISVYITIGTGIGGGATVDGRILHGLSHPEMGHIRPARHPADLDFPGCCPFHGDCLEGLASGPAIKARWGASLSELSADHPGHAIIAWYLAQMVLTLQAVMEPGRIIFGGGVMDTPDLLCRVREEAGGLASGYFKGKAIDIIVAPELGDKAGIMGGLALAMDAAKAKA